MILLQRLDAPALIAGCFTGLLTAKTLHLLFNLHRFPRGTHRVPLFGPALQRSSPGLALKLGWFGGGVIRLLLGHLTNDLFDQFGDPFIDWHHGANGKPWIYRFIFLPVVGVASPADMYYILQGNQLNFVKSWSYRVLDKLLGEGGLVAVVDESQHTVQRRELSRAFSPAALTHIANLTVQRQAKHVLDQLALATSHSQDGSGSPVIVQEVLNKAAMNVIAAAAFHSDDDSTTEQIVKDFNTIITLGAGAGRFIPLVDMLYAKQNALVRAARQRLHKLVLSIADRVRLELEEKRRQKSSEVPGLHLEEEPYRGDEGRGEGEEEEQLPAIIDYLVLSKVLTPEQVLAHSMTFLFAGSETSSTTMQWTLYLLAMHHNTIQQRLYESLCDVLQLGGLCQIETIQKCEYLQLVIKESLRLYPPAAVISRVSVQDDVLPSGQFLPAGSFLAPNFFAMQRDPHLWGADANEFRPERWEEPIVVRNNLEETAFMPFAIGKRNCIGKDFAMNEMLLLLGVLVRNYQFTWPEGAEPPQRALAVTMRPAKPFALRVERRVS